MDILLKIGIVLGIGLIFGKLAKLVKLPSVSGYLIAGLLISPSLFGLIGFKGSIMSIEELKSLDFISELALAFIAFSIGSEFSLADMKKYGKKVFIITVTEVIGAVLLVFLVMFFAFKQSVAFSLVIAAMSAATAPAATLLVMKQYRAYGPMSKTLLSVVALDDVVGIIVFGICLPLAKMSINPETVSVGKMFLAPMIEIFGSLLIGFGLGIALAYLAKKQKDKDDLQIISLIAVVLGVGIAKLADLLPDWVSLSPLLINIMIGTTIVNVVKKPGKIFDSINNFSPVFLVLFFTIAGAKIDLDILKIVGLMGIVYVLCRGLGKYIGAWIGGKVSKAEKSITNFLGLGLLPQGGISLGLSIIVANQMPSDIASKIITIIMFSILIYETTGPIFSKMAISLAKEVNGLDQLGFDQQGHLAETDTETKAGA